MMRGFRRAWPAVRLWCLGVLGPLCLIASVRAADGPSSAAGPQPEKYLLRYRFREGDTVRWNVVHRCQIRTTVGETTQTAETTTTSVKVWRVRQVQADGTASVEYLVEDVDMRNRLTGRDEVHYNSNKDAAPPPGFQQFAQAVGVPLAVVTLDGRGKILQQKQNVVKAAPPSSSGLTLPFPDDPVAVGQQWSFPHPIEVPLPEGGVRRVKSLQTFTLQSVKTGVASIRVTTEILTPIHDPALQSQLLQFISSGTVRFDIEAGRILGQQLDVDQGVVGFRGAASSIHYVSRATEELLPPQTRIASHVQ
jgi:hypothetical protein